ncbi:MAG: fructose-bisphosphate aldolase, class [Acetobacteraceae bacterium]|nr:fructose-bisphosphate aldolase, class [Acetobacteraceae bacterium]
MVQKPDEFDPRKFFAAATKAASDLCRARFEQFGCAGRASSIKPVSLDRMTEMYAKGQLDQVVH